MFAVGELPAIPLKPAILRCGFATDDGAGCCLEAAHIVYNAIGIHKAVMVLVLYTAAIIIGGNGLSAIKARDKFSRFAVLKLK